MAPTMDKLEADISAGMFPAVHLKTLVERVCSQAQAELASLGSSAGQASDETKCALISAVESKCKGCTGRSVVCKLAKVCVQPKPAVQHCMHAACACMYASL